MSVSACEQLGPGEVDPTMESSADAIVIANANGVIEFVNPAFESMTGFSRGEVIGRTPAILKSGEHGAEFYSGLWASILKGEVFRGVFVNRKKSGEIYYEEKVIIPFVGYGGRITHFLSTGRDVTRRLQKADQLKRRATHDLLTDLPNRCLFMDRLSQTVKLAARRSEEFALAVADIDGFNAVNKSLGNDVGDALLLSVAFQLRQCIREADTVARLGGDEFGLILTDVGNRSHAANVFEKIIAALPSTVGADHRPVRAALSIGACVFPADGRKDTQLLHHAGAAMYKVKRSGGNGYSFFGAHGAQPTADRDSGRADSAGRDQGGDPGEACSARYAHSR